LYGKPKKKKSSIAPEDQEMACMRRRGYQAVDAKALKLPGYRPARS
jgi:hypothetical protein